MSLYGRMGEEGDGWGGVCVCGGGEQTNKKHKITNNNNVVIDVLFFLFFLSMTHFRQKFTD